MGVFKTCGQHKKSGMIRIQNVILNSEIISDWRDLYCIVFEQLNSVVLSFGTYFNSLWPQRWKEYTNISDFYLNIRFKGDCGISIIQSRLIDVVTDELADEKISRDIIYRKRHTSDGSEYVRIKLPEIDPACRIIHFELEYPKTCKFEYLDAYFSAESNLPPVRVRMAVIFCTFKAERYIHNNIAQLKAYFERNPDMADAYDVFVVDNGKTLSKEIESNNIFLFPNKNTGGSGGFARGILEAVQSGKDYTHVILMDDDVEINTESLGRTYALTSLVNERYSRSFVSGSMLLSDIKDFQWEARAATRGLLLKIYGRLSLSNFSGLLKNEAASTKHTPYDYAAWWYCCIPLKSIGPDKLPFPFFVRGDDIDYSLKYADKIIHLNGICVWHEPFMSRRSNVMDIYITVRNFLVTSIINQKWFIFFIFDVIKVFACQVFSYNYNGAYLVCCGLNDAISKKDIYEKDQVELLNRYKRYNETEQPMAVDLSEALKMTKPSWFRKILIIATYGGHILPGILFRKDSTAMAYGRLAVLKCFTTRKVYIYNPRTGRSSIREFNRTKAFTSGFRFCFILLKLILCFRLIRKRLQKQERYYKTVEFWKKHLELD